MEKEFDIDYRLFDKLEKALVGSKYSVVVGVMGDHNARTSKNGGGKTNAEIGLKHEFGEDGMPIRSFLRMPLSTKLFEAMEDSGAFDEETLKQIVDTASLKGFLGQVGIIAEGVVQEAFDTGGFGQWKESNMSRKKNHQTLVETGQLRDSISSKVVKE